MGLTIVRQKFFLRKQPITVLQYGGVRWILGEVFGHKEPKFEPPLERTEMINPHRGRR